MVLVKFMNHTYDMLNFISDHHRTVLLLEICMIETTQEYISFTFVLRSDCSGVTKKNTIIYLLEFTYGNFSLRISMLLINKRIISDILAFFLQNVDVQSLQYNKIIANCHEIQDHFEQQYVFPDYNDKSVQQQTLVKLM